jgi:cardiolipin synthase
MLTTIALASILLIIVVMALVIWSIRRHRDPHLKIECNVGIDTLLPTLAGLTLARSWTATRSRSWKTASAGTR